MVYVLADLDRRKRLTAFPTAGMTAASDSFAETRCCARRYILQPRPSGTPGQSARRSSAAGAGSPKRRRAYAPLIGPRNRGAC